MGRALSPDLSRGRPVAGQDASELPAVSPTALIEETIPLGGKSAEQEAGWRYSADPTPLDDLDQKHHQGEDKQDMDETSHRVGTDESERPEDKENNGDSVEHGIGVLWVLVVVKGLWAI